MFTAAHGLAIRKKQGVTLNDWVRKSGWGYGWASMPHQPGQQCGQSQQLQATHARSTRCTPE